MDFVRDKRPPPHSIAEQILELEAKLNLRACAFGLNPKKTPEIVKSRLFSRDIDFLKRVYADLNHLLTVFERCEIEHVDPWDDRHFIPLFMRELGVIYPKDFLGKIEAGDVVEGYDMHHRQFFRNMRFMEISGYSLLEIASSEWPELYDRPRAVIEKMLSFCDEILWRENRTIPFTVPQHFVRELLSEERNTYEIEFKKLTPLFFGPNRPFGMIGTSSIRVVSPTEAAHRLSFV